MEASKEGRSLSDFKYACVGYSVFLDNKDNPGEKQEKRTELPACIGFEVVILINLFPLKWSNDFFSSSSSPSLAIVLYLNTKKMMLLYLILNIFSSKELAASP